MEDNSNTRSIIKLALGAAFVLAILIAAWTGFVTTADAEWQIIQYPNGTVRVIDQAGFNQTWWGSHWTYPRNFQVEYDKEFSFSVTFNDASTAKMNAIVRFAAPTTVEGKRELHRQFGGNMVNIEAAVWAHLSNAIKASGPIMSSSEHQSARQSEFNQLVLEQLNNGLYETRKIQRTLHDQFDDKGKPITVFATEVVLDEKGRPQIANVSPLAKLGLVVTQFSITHVEYDEMTRNQFAAKKGAFLSAENSKAQREKEVQERLMVEEKGRRERAEAEAIANKQKAKEVIDAEREKAVAETKAAQRVAVALQDKLEAETKAAQEKQVAEIAAQRQVEVAKQQKLEAETKAAQELEVAKLNRQAAEENAAKQIALAKAQEESLKIAGAISEKERVLAEIEREKAIGVARELAKISVPATVIGGNSGGDSSGTGNLVNLFMLERLGVLPKTK